MDGWNNFYVGWPIFRGYVSFREQRRSLQTKNNLRSKVGDVYCVLHQDIMLFILFEQKSNIFRCFYHPICQWQVACGRSYPGSRGYPWNLLFLQFHFHSPAVIFPEIYIRDPKHLERKHGINTHEYYLSPNPHHLTIDICISWKLPDVLFLQLEYIYT